MPEYRIKVADKETGDEHEFTRVARNASDVEREAIGAGWLVMSCEPIEGDELEWPRKGTLWTPKDPTERAVVRGIVKAYLIIVISHTVAAFSIWAVYAMISNYINP